MYVCMHVGSVFRIQCICIYVCFKSDDWKRENMMYANRDRFERKVESWELKRGIWYGKGG